jgi:tetratricopeptide (TPR) repeat protein
MWGDGPAFLALILFAFDPNFLAHGALVTTDVAVTLGIFLGVGSFYFYLKKTSVLKLIGAGIAAGICLSSKHSGILVFPMLLVLSVTEVATWEEIAARKLSPDLAKNARRLVLSLAAISAIAVTVLWSMYGFRFAARPAGLHVNPSLPEFVRQTGQSSSGIVMLLAPLRVLPESYLYGIADISSAGSIPTLIFGKYYPSAQWFYFPSVFVVKSTLAFLVLIGLLPLCKKLWGKPFQREMFFLVIPPAIYLAVAMSSGINYGIRHLLPIYPFLIVLASITAWNLGQRHRALAAVVAALIVFHVASSLHAFPNYIPYSNELWGGPSKTHEILTDSNVDWGQGLVAMKQYIDERHIANCWFAYFGRFVVDVSYYGIPCKPLPTAFAEMNHVQMAVVPPQVDGPVFISTTEVARTYWRADWVNPYLPFQGVPPTALIADSILVYDGKVDLSEVAALAHENLAMQLLNEHKLEQALAEANLAVAVAPNRPLAQLTRGRILLAMGRNTEADDELRIADALANKILAQGHQ